MKRFNLKKILWLFSLPAGLAFFLAVPSQRAEAQVMIYRIEVTDPDATSAPSGQDSSPSATTPAAQGSAAPDASGTSSSTATYSVPVTTPALPGESPYDYYMRLGYAASQSGDPSTALTYFNNALSARPGDRLATIAYWNMVDLLRTAEPQPRPAALESDGAEPESDYERYMNIGYNATEQGNYQTALINFERALSERPDDPYASQAIRNVRTYIGEQ